MKRLTDSHIFPHLIPKMKVKFAVQSPAIMACRTAATAAPVREEREDGGKFGEGRSHALSHPRPVSVREKA
ncbi:hypothetical protein PUN28_003610 [Cardiocondyla obscurior]|uniref:Uncharacterized protein n=1 Tax=Cardiocondyla obscurior TaxID=286306 RepID=A0AAW2GMK2_9HYME